MLEEKNRLMWHEKKEGQIWWGKRGMLLLLQEQTCLAFFSLSVAVSENVLGPASAKCPRLTGINRMHMHLRYFSWSRAPCTSFLKAAVCLGPLSSQDLWLFWMAVAPWGRILRASSTNEHCLENFSSGWMLRWAANLAGKECLQPSVCPEPVRVTRWTVLLASCCSANKRW